VKLGGLTIEKSEMVLGIVVTITSIAFSIAAAYATMNVRLDQHDKGLASSAEDIKYIQVQVNNLVSGQARIEGILDEMRREKK